MHTVDEVYRRKKSRADARLILIGHGHTVDSKQCTVCYTDYVCIMCSFNILYT